MSLPDYDLVILGGSITGRYAAFRASQFRAKVALVEPPDNQQNPQQALLWLDSVAPHALSQIGRLTQQLKNASQLGMHWANTGAAPNRDSLPPAEARQWVEALSENLEAQHSLPVLSAMGVDVIIGSGQFTRRSPLTFTIGDRQLRARNYLLAPSSLPAIPQIEGLQTTGYVTAQEIWQVLTASTPPKRWAIIGGDPTAIQLAHTFTRLGLDVTLVIKRSQILAQADLEITQLIQANLEAAGVRVLTATPVIQVKQIQQQKWIQAGNKAIEVDEILLCAGNQPQIANLNLEAVGVRFNRHRLQLNQKLQTTNRRIYACGDAIGGYQFTNVANYEARIALKNALFFPLFKVDYRSIPWAIFAEPPIAIVGLTAAQAKRQFERETVVLRQYFKGVAVAQLQDEITGICQLVVCRSGKILGATIVGIAAAELINVIALAIAQGLSVNALAKLAPVYPSFAEILDQIAITWHQQRLANNSTLQNLLESFFNWRRS